MTSSHTLGPADGDLLLFTTAEGKAARLGHALTLRVADWQATVELDGDAAVSVVLTAQLASLEVLAGKGGVKPLSDKDKRSILDSAGKTLDVSKYPVLTYTSSSIEPGYVVHGTVDLHGSTQPLDVAVTVDGSSVAAEATLGQRSFGISPYSQMMGALQVGNDVAVRLTVTISR